MSQVFRQDKAAYEAAPRRKESFGAVYGLLRREHVKSVLDLGCASGDFLYYLPAGIAGTGVDVSPGLLALAKKRAARPGVAFERADFLDPALRRRLKARRFDAVTMLGFLHTFLDFEAPLSAALGLGARTVIVHSPFNEEPVDARHFHRLAGERKYQCGYSIFSKASVSRFLERRGVRRFGFIPFRMRGSLKKNPSSPVRNWHARVDGRKRLVNGIGIIMDEFLLVIHPGRR